MAPGDPPKAPKLAPKSAQNRPRTLIIFFKILLVTALGAPGASQAPRTPPGPLRDPLREPPGSPPGPSQGPPGTPPRLRDPLGTPPGTVSESPPGYY